MLIDKMRGYEFRTEMEYETLLTAEWRILTFSSGFGPLWRGFISIRNPLHRSIYHYRIHVCSIAFKLSTTLCIMEAFLGVLFFLLIFKTSTTNPLYKYLEIEYIVILIQNMEAHRCAHPLNQPNRKYKRIFRNALATYSESPRYEVSKSRNQ